VRVGFYHAARGDETVPRARIAALVASVRSQMPAVRLTHFTDLVTAPIVGVDDVLRRPMLPIAHARIDAYAAVEGDWLFLDTDVIVQENVSDVFRQSFDVAVSDRVGTLRDVDYGTKFMALMPYNSGVMFSRCQAFWRAALQAVDGYSPKRKVWMGDQQALCDVIASGRFAVAVLPSRFNYPPHRHDEDVSDKAILHFKGKTRKSWMLQRDEVAA
jgi:hypothetical protein